MIGIFYIPKILVSIAHFGFLYSFYCFEYKWGTDTDFHKNLAFYEKYFAYFTGFGSIYAVCCLFVSGMTSTGVYSVLLPIFLLISISASPRNVD